MAEQGAENGARYWAFISYSHKDAAFGRRLHRRLESYALPKRLVGRDTQQGIVPRKLAPIFRDREELPAANDLSAEVRAALGASRSLIVVCSPAAAASPWVGREIAAFRELHPDRPVLAAIRQGEPVDCFPDTLHQMGPDGAVLEPLAADFRKGQDGEQLGLLKLVAGIVGVGLDELVQRDALRRTQRVTAVTAGALAAMIVMGVLTVFAFTAQREAERQRGEAEGLVEYMLTDLRDKLKGVGRLDIMGAVNKRAMDYYSKQKLDALPPNSLERRARILHAMGEDDEARGDHVASLRKFREAARTTSRLLSLAPDDPERIFDQAQSEYWIGSVDFNRGRFQAAKPAYENYKRLSDRTVKIAPGNTKYRMEAAYADGNLCSIALEKPQNVAAAVKLCAEALRQMESVERLLPTSITVKTAVVNRHAWLADAYVAKGDRAAAWTERKTEERMLQQLMDADPLNADLQDSWISLQRALARLEILDGRIEPALRRLDDALVLLDRLIAKDPNNNSWKQQRERIVTTLKHFAAKRGQPQKENPK